MNSHQKAYCDGAAMAYQGVADKLKDMIVRAPPIIRDLMEATQPLIDSCERKAKDIYTEAERMEHEQKH